MGSGLSLNSEVSGTNEQQHRGTETRRGWGKGLIPEKAVDSRFRGNDITSKQKLEDDANYLKACFRSCGRGSLRANSAPPRLCVFVVCCAAGSGLTPIVFGVMGHGWRFQDGRLFQDSNLRIATLIRMRGEGLSVEFPVTKEDKVASCLLAVSLSCCPWFRRQNRSLVSVRRASRARGRYS